MATILHSGTEVISIIPGIHGLLPDFVDYRVTRDNKPTNQWVRIRNDNWMNHNHVDISLLENQASPLQRPTTINSRSFDRKSRTLASIPELRKKGVRLVPATNFQIEHPQALRAEKITIRP